MTTLARGQHILKGAFISIGTADPKTGVVTPQVVAFQYNPATLRRSLQPQLAGGEENDRSEAVRFTGAPVQTISLDVEIDATDQLDAGGKNAELLGILPQLAALELLAYPTLNQVNQNQKKLAAGVMEVTPMSAPRLLFVWGSKRVLPVRLTGYSITEEIFDRMLRTIRATVSINMRVLNYSDLDSSNKEYHEFMVYQENLRSMAGASSKQQASPFIGVNTSPL